MKILFITDNFPPEVNAPATRTYEHCVEWVKQGAEVTVITGFPNFPQGKVYKGYKNVWKKTEMTDGIKVIRVWTYMAENKGFAKRILDYISFSITAFFAGLRCETDVIIATSPQFFTCFTGYSLSRIKKTKWVLEIRDLWPESLWMLSKKSLKYKIFSKLEYFFYKKANTIITVTQSFKKTMIQNGINKNKIHVCYNGINFDKFVSKKELSLTNKKELNIKEKIIVGYLGTFGVAQNLSFFIEHIAKEKHKYSDIHFVFIGDGANKNKMISIKEKNKLSNVTIMGIVPKNKVPEYLSIFDIGLVPLRNKKAYLKVIPSKIFELAALKIPILLGVMGESENIIKKYNLGISFKPENELDFSEKLKNIIKTENIKGKYDEFYNNFNRKNIALNMYEILKY